VVSVFVLVAVPIGVSTRSVVVVRERSTVGSGLLGSTGAGAGAWTIVVSFSLMVGWTTVVGSFTMVVEEVVEGRSHPARAASERAMAVGRTYFI
jgi:hypothetical protein